MDSRAFDPHNPATFAAPVPPQEFGQDGGKFYHYYDALADEIDDYIRVGLNEQLHGIFIFAGLFAGVNTAFLVLTLPLMRPDPADDTNALLRDNNIILLNLALGRNDSLPSINPLPSETFSPSGQILTVNILFSLSLTFAIISSFLAELGRHWLLWYGKRTGGGPERQRWEQLKRFLGAQRWRLEWILDGFLPSLLHMGLIIFCISLAVYLNTLHPMLSSVVGAFMGAGAAILVITSIFATWDNFCPFQSPLSHTLSYTISNLLPFVGYTAAVLAFILLILISILLHSITIWPFKLLLGTINALHSYYVHGPHSITSPWVDIELYWEPAGLLSEYVIDPILAVLEREEEGDGVLQITAIRRAICTSDDFRTQTHAVSNILAITDGNLLCQLATDNDFQFRISELGRSSFNRTLQLCGRDKSNVAAETSWLYRAAVTHVTLLATDPKDGRRFGRRAISWITSDASTSLLSLDIIRRAPPNMLTAWLGYLADSYCDYPSEARHLALGFIMDELLNPSWRCISMATVAVTVMWGVNESDHEVLHDAYTGKPPVALRNLDLAVKKYHDHHCQDRDTLSKYVVKILKLTGKAAISSITDSSGRSSGVLGVLAFLERLIRAQDSSSDLIDIGRSLRGELVNALCTMCEKPPRSFFEYPGSALEEILEESLRLFTDLTADPKPPAINSDFSPVHHRPRYLAIDGGRSTTPSYKDDEELADSFISVLQKLNVLANTIRDSRHFYTHEQDQKFKRDVTELNGMFATFQAAVKSASPEIKRRKRDPDFGWCYYDEECELQARSGSRPGPGPWLV